MRRVIFLVLTLLLLLLVGFVAWALLADPKPDMTTVEQVIPNDRFAN